MPCITAFDEDAEAVKSFDFILNAAADVSRSTCAAIGEDTAAYEGVWSEAEALDWIAPDKASAHIVMWLATDGVVGETSAEVLVVEVSEGNSATVFSVEAFCIRPCVAVECADFELTWLKAGATDWSHFLDLNGLSFSGWCWGAHRTGDCCADSHADNCECCCYFHFGLVEVWLNTYTMIIPLRGTLASEIVS